MGPGVEPAADLGVEKLNLFFVEEGHVSRDVPRHVGMLVEVQLHALPRHEHHLRHLREAQGMRVLRWFSARVGKHM